MERSASFNAPVGHADLDLVGDFILSMSPGEEEVGKSVSEDRIPEGISSCFHYLWEIKHASRFSEPRRALVPCPAEATLPSYRREVFALSW